MSTPRRKRYRSREQLTRPPTAQPRPALPLSAHPAPPPEVSDTAQEQPAPTEAQPPTQEEIDEQIILRAIQAAKDGLPVNEDVKLLAQLYDDIARMEDLLKQQEALVEEQEKAEAERAKTPLALKLEIVGCQLAQMVHPGDPTKPETQQTIPEFIFENEPCIQGKAQPDQDCRNCVYCKIIPYGNNLPVHHRRYRHHGMVIPIKNEEEATKIAKMLNVLGAKPLVHPPLVLHTLKKNLEVARRRRYEARERELARRQAERFEQFRPRPRSVQP
jgi:hypothetical protein